MSKIIFLDKSYSTTKLLTKDKPKTAKNMNEEFQKLLFFPKSKNRFAEGGLRLKGYFKKSFDEKPLITIITVVFNSKNYLEESILSVINQTYDNIEYIVIDGGSTDGSLDIIKKYENQIDYLISEKDGGVFYAWNKALKLSQGKWISFLGADDFYKTNAIQKYVKKIISSQEIEYISSKSNYITENKKLKKVIGRAWNWKEFSKYMNVAHVGSLHSSSLFKKYGNFDINFPVCADYEFLLRAGKNLKADFINEILCNFRAGGQSQGHSHWGINEIFHETYKAKIKNKSRPSDLHVYFDTLWSKLKWNIKKVLGRL